MHVCIMIKRLATLMIDLGLQTNWIDSHEICMQSYQWIFNLSLQKNCLRIGFFQIILFPERMEPGMNQIGS
jgi:hypothetical protein